MVTLLHRQSVEEAGWGEGGECADGMRQHSFAPYPVEGLPVDASINLQQGVAFVAVLRQG